MQINVRDQSATESTRLPQGRVSSIAVLGAGVAGLSAARVLQAAGHRVLVFDKGRRAAGRISTRRSERFAFDHGAQYFTARDPRFVAEVETWLEQRFVAPWQGRIVSLGFEGDRTPVGPDTVRYVGVPGMSALAGYLASDLEVESGAEITSMQRVSGGWRLRGEREDFGAYDKVLITLPAPQAATLLDVAPRLQERVQAVRFRPTWAVLLGLAERYDVDFDGAFVADSPLAWIARNSSKPGRPDTEAWVLHAAPTWSHAYQASDPGRVFDRLTRELVERTGVELPEVAHGTSRFWRYALPDPPLETGPAADPELGLAVAGDWTHGARIEGAFLSGLEAASELTAEPVLR